MKSRSLCYHRAAKVLKLTRGRHGDRAPFGARIEAPEAPRGWGLGTRGTSRLGGLGERRKLPQWGPGQSPGRQRFLVLFDLTELF